MAVLIEVPGSAAAFHDLHVPMGVVGRDCNCKCDRSRHHHSAKDSNQKDASRFHVHFDYSLIEARLQAGLLFEIKCKSSGEFTNSLIH